MGSTTKYADFYEREATNKHWAEVMAKGVPASLKSFEIDLEHQALTRSPKARPVTAWVRYGDEAVHVLGWTTAWTDRAVAVRWITPHGVEHKAWVWSGAVEPRELTHSERLEAEASKRVRRG